MKFRDNLFTFELSLKLGSKKESHLLHWKLPSINWVPILICMNAKISNTFLMWECFPLWNSFAINLASSLFKMTALLKSIASKVKGKSIKRMNFNTLQIRALRMWPRIWYILSTKYGWWTREYFHITRDIEKNVHWTKTRRECVFVNKSGIKSDCKLTGWLDKQTIAAIFWSRFSRKTSIEGERASERENSDENKANVR